MKRLVLGLLVPALLSTLACSAYGSAEPKVAPPGRFEVPVDPDAFVAYYSLKIKPGETDVVWKAPADRVEKLWIAFKPADSGTPPADPACQGASCTLPATSSAGKDGVFEYVVGVKLVNASKWKLRDPRLIIKP